MKSSLALITVLLALTAIYFFGSPAGVPNSQQKAIATPPPPDTAKSSEELLQLIRYENLTQITPRPFRIPQSSDTTPPCAPFPGFVVSEENGAKFKHAIAEKRDHRALLKNSDTAIQIYVTPNGERAIKDLPAVFPKDAIVLKEKFVAGNLSKPELYTGMIKREKGYNPECGDWEFFTVDGTGKTITSRGKLAHCMECHKDYSGSDFVTKKY